MMDSFCDDFSQSLVCIGDSRIPSQVPDSQPPLGSLLSLAEGMKLEHPVADFVAVVAVEVSTRLVASKKNKSKQRTDAEKALKVSQKGTMKWLSFMSAFVLEKMCTIIKSGVRTDKGFKEVHLAAVARALKEHCGCEATSTQVYNHLRKWRTRWLTVSRLRDLSGAQWCEDTKAIILENEHYNGHVTDHAKDAEYLNNPIANYDEMQIIFSFGLATGKYAMGSGEPLGMPPAASSAEECEGHESDTTNLDGAPDKVADKGPDASEKVFVGERKRGAFADDELVAFTNMMFAVKDVAQAIRDNKPTNMHPDLYSAVMDTPGFIEVALMMALSHLVDHKAQGTSFVGMVPPHMVLWLRTYLGKYYSPQE